MQNVSVTHAASWQQNMTGDLSWLFFHAKNFLSRVPATCSINSKKTATWKGAKEAWKHTSLCPIRSGPQARNFRRKQRYKVFETCIFSLCLIINKISEKFVWPNEGSLFRNVYHVQLTKTHVLVHFIESATLQSLMKYLTPGHYLENVLFPKQSRNILCLTKYLHELLVEF